MLEAITANLIATGIAKSTGYSVRTLLDRFEQQPEIKVAADAFEKELRNSIFELFQEGSEYSEDQFQEKWDKISLKIQDIDVIFEEEGVAIENISDILAEQFDAVETDTRSELESAVAGGYSKGISAFKAEVRDKDLFDELGLEVDREILTTLGQLEERMRILQATIDPLKFYHIFEADDPGTRAAESYFYEQENVFQEIQYVPRNVRGTSGRRLIVGRKGAGKSREIGREIRQVAQTDSISHIVIIKRAFTRQEDIRPLLRENFQGDVLLIWDDIHKVNPDEKNNFVRDTLLKLEDILERDGYSLDIVAAARSDELDSIPGYDSPDDPIWSTFETIRLDTLILKDINI